jgi:hypothetical protein
MSASVPPFHDDATVVIPAHEGHEYGSTLPACLRAVLAAAVCLPIPVVPEAGAHLAGRHGTDTHLISVDVHDHGADMGFSARAYRRVGGMRTPACGEGVDLVRRFEAAGYSVHGDTDLPVITSAASRGRGPSQHPAQPGGSAAGDDA